MISIPIGYLIPALLVLLSVYFIVAPPSWPRPFRFWWGIAAVVNELPLFAALFLVASTALAISEDDIYSLGGWIAFGLNLASVIGLILLFCWSLQAPPAIRRAFTDGLGDNWSDRLDSKLAKRLDKNFSGKALLGPFFIRSANVQHIRNISYGNAGRYHTLDIYHKRSSSPRSPIFIHIHGGALRTGRKDHDALPVLYHLAK